MNHFAPRPLVPLVQALRKGTLALEDHLNQVCDHLDEVEPLIQALLPEPGRRERLLAQARQLTARYPDPGSRPPLFGVLLGVKDLFSADGFETRAGSRLPPELFAMPEARVVTALKQAGCLVLGKTVTTEFAYFSPGPTRNPWAPERTPGGSSSGSAAAVAAGFCSLALGTQTIGSISRPAAFCGVSGFKPTWGRIPDQGLVPFAPSLDHVGLLAPTAADLELAASLVLENPVEPGPVPQPPVLAVPVGPYLTQAEAGTLEQFQVTLTELSGRGFQVISLPALEDIEEINLRHRRIAAAELARVHARWFREHGDLYSQTTAALIREGLAIGEDTLNQDLAGCSELRLKLDSLLTKARATAWVCPATLAPAPHGIHATGSPLMNLPFTHAGLPTLSLPLSRSSQGLPLGLQLAGRFGEDELLLKLGARLSGKSCHS